MKSRSITPVKVLISTFLLSLSAQIGYADEIIEFELVKRARPYAKASCRSVHETSRSYTSKSTSRYQAYLTPLQLKSLISQKSYMEFEKLMTRTHIKAYGQHAYASLKSVEMMVSLVSRDGEELLSNMFYWGFSFYSASQHFHKNFVSIFNFMCIWNVMMRTKTT